MEPASPSRNNRYRMRRQLLIEQGILLDRKPGRPRIYAPEEAVLVARKQKRESYFRMREQIRHELVRRGLTSIDQLARSTAEKKNVL